MEILRNILLNKTNNVLIQLFRYTFVGGFAFLVDWGCLVLLTEVVGIYYLYSSIISFTLGLVVNYIISTRWVFGKSDIKNKYLEFIVFAIIGILGLGLNTLCLYIFTEICNVHYALSKPITAIIVYLWNFLGRRFLIFNAKS